ncbi:MAG: phosphoglycolate phosphatase [Gammaproteobacteria bacterium]|nr:phosphoglycolate phosphatase [Gammaproteobacteria bacterium]
MIESLPKAILIDVDGTMVDSVPDLAYCVDAMMKALAMPEHGADKVRHWVGNGVERLVRRALIGQLHGEPDDALFAKAYPMFLELYAANTCERSSLYPGVREGIDYLKSTNIRLGCVTNKAAQFTLPLLKALGIYADFEIVISGDSLPKKKPDPMPLLHGAAHFSVPANEAMMIGDSISDVKAARAAGFKIICMTYGYNHGIDIRDSNPDAVIDSMTELTGLFTKAA